MYRVVVSVINHETKRYEHLFTASNLYSVQDLRDAYNELVARFQSPNFSVEPARQIDAVEYMTPEEVDAL